MSRQQRLEQMLLKNEEKSEKNKEHEREDLASQTVEEIQNESRDTGVGS